jgi:hypothetical protein
MHIQVRPSGECVTNCVALLCVEFGQPCFEMSCAHSSERTEGNHEDMIQHTYLHPFSGIRAENFAMQVKALTFAREPGKVDRRGKLFRKRRPAMLVNQRSWRQCWTRIQPPNNRLGTSSPMAFYPLRQDGLRLRFSARGNTHFHLWRKLGSMTLPLRAASCVTTDFHTLWNEINK